MSNFFIDRPVFAWVVVILIMLAGLLAIKNLPVAQYPEVAPPAISVAGIYPGASPQNVQDTVVQTIEQQMTGLDGFRYMSASTAADGSFNLIVTFDQGVDSDIAQVQVQNKLQLALPMLPIEVQAQGISVTKHQMSFMLIIALYCEDGSLTYEELSDYLVSNIKDPLARTEGVGEAIVWASQFAMRIWLNPEKLYSYQLVPSDVVEAIENQNVQISAGQIGGKPTKKDVLLNASIISKSRFTSIEEFEEILLKVNDDGSQVRLKDVASIELGSETYGISGKYNGYPAANMALRLSTDGNIIEATKAVMDTIEDLKPQFPAGAKIAYTNEIAPTVQDSINSVLRTLTHAIILVFLVMWLFLQNLRTTLIPTLTIPVVLLGTFAVIYSFGMTINIITMFALILTIGLLVDDAIVVVENVERLIHEEKLSPKEATRKSMGQLQGALVGIGLVISAVFFPMAFFTGSTGAIYRQFSITIIAAMLLSVFTALSFTPALCASFLQSHDVPRRTNAFFDKFNDLFQKSSNFYTRTVGKSLSQSKRYFLIFLVILGIIIALYPQLQSSFLPDEDQGLVSIMIELPPNSTEDRTMAVVDEISNYFTTEEKDIVRSVIGVTGFSYAGQGQNVGMAFLTLRSFDTRKDYSQSVYALVERASARFASIPDAQVQPLIPPSITELGNAAGFNFFLQDRAALGHEKLMEARDSLLRLVWSDPDIAAAWTNSLPYQPQYFVHIDDEKVRSGISSLAEINQAMSIAWGSAYVNDFVHNGRLKKVYVQGDYSSRAEASDFDRWHLRSKEGDMIPFSSFMTGEWIMGPPKMERYNGFPAVEFLGFGAHGVSSGAAMNKMSQLADQLPEGLRLSFTGLSYEEIQAGDQTFALYSLSLLIVFLCLAALYESWIVPISVMLIMPFGVLGALALTFLRGHANDVFFQVGILTVIGLSAKNSILIVEFAHHMYVEGKVKLKEAVVEAAKLRLRPILMTSLAFILGVSPMMLASGASSASQQSLGTSVVGGTFFATFLAIFFVPLFYYTIARLTLGKKMNN